jgi:hypothetical protein
VNNVIYLTQQDFSERDFVVACPHCGSEIAEASSIGAARNAARLICEEEGWDRLVVRAKHSGRVEVVIVR